ncbi:hypothetical protein LARI1_G000213 [Lachnellula arida]|uniref:Transcription initiation factor TFIID subunit 4 n=1 Tax=Lachnellula arida TaxID=1316785 RepID=A0A8T9BTA0_9HELO|nr:hypothetical protein LARI1_G000213 [Lachnellula arida]
MAQPPPPQQQQYAMPSQQYSPPHSAAAMSPATSQFPFPPAKKQRLSPNPPSQPGSPYVQSPYAMSPGTAAPQSASASPHFANVQLPPNVYNTPYSNGHTTPNINLPQSQPIHQNHQQPNPLNLPNQINMQNNFNDYNMAPRGAGSMGPPSKPADRSREDGVDMMDVLGGTGVDIREEEQYMYQSFNSQQSGSQSGTISSSHSFTQFPPGDERSFYGAGPANAAPDQVNGKSQEEYEKKAADKAWHDAARNISASRQRELSDPFLDTAHTQKKEQRIAQEHGLLLHLGPNGLMGQMTLPNQFSQSNVNVQTAVGPNGAMTATSGNFLSPESLVVDQLCLLSIATKHRLRGFIEEAAKLAKGRQTGSHGIVPSEWADAAAPASMSTAVPEGGPRSGWESAVSPQSIPRKRSHSAANKLPTPVSDGSKTPSEPPKFTNEVVSALRASAVKERADEEERLRKRAARAARASGDVTRSGSVIPGTPGSIAPEAPEKGSSKKETKKKAESKASEEANHKAANATTSQFLSGSRGLFGKKKQYSWMSNAASGTSTPSRLMTSGLPGTPAVAPAPEKLTAEGVRRLGMWREDKEKGTGIQLRDWICVLEDDGHEKRALQKAYALLDGSEPK